MARRTKPTDVIAQIYAATPHLLRLPGQKAWVDYDEGADVLYVSLKRPQKATESEYLDEEGVILSYRNDELVGITVLDASKRAVSDERTDAV